MLSPPNPAQQVPVFRHHWHVSDGGRGGTLDEGSGRTQETLMVGMRSDRARARARDLLDTRYPIPDDAESLRLRELAIDYIQQANRLETENRGHVAESDELISAALDAVARDYFGRALSKAKSRTKA
jgi:hypothetical protein